MQKSVPFSEVVIDPSSDLQIHYWAKDMLIQPHELRDAVRLIGPRLCDLRKYFGRSAAIICLRDRREPRTVSPYGLPA
ncbi:MULTISPECIES: DUF3606 domain-containing protein [unclassified Bradyrhizobium]|uniref:DUF3606 domain-containing protein n=1 Tax=Bradyrhizobium sp. JYMT SZCCT0428 TaxID=2807673 RepID=UPI001BA6DCDB|nr:DUF3606 domain-containing protein [Bradyrhizobium sp. JYMT SZCCT0428]MBR1216223.1 DUF3606 domain-containing protein [Bradyrhizobium sp. JYMT SZCCT0180]